MKKMILLVFAGLSFTLSGCGNLEILDSRAFNSSWTPQFSTLAEYFGMNGTSFYNGAPFNADVGFLGTVKNPNGSGMSSLVGKVGTAVEFDGIDDRIEVANNIGHNNNIFSISVWVKRSTATGSGCVLTSRDDSPARGYSICVNGSEQPEVKIGQGSGAGAWTTVTGTPIVLNSWTHIAVTYDGSLLSLYKNGTLEASSVSAFSYNTTKPLYIGAGGTELSPSASDFFTGIIDEVGVWQTVLSATEVATIYNKQK